MSSTMSAIFLHHNENLSHVTLMFPKNFSFLATLNSTNHGHVLTRKLAFLISIAKQVLERKTMNFRFDITNSRFSRTDFTMRQIHPERKYLVADVPTYQLKVHSILGILHACYRQIQNFDANLMHDVLSGKAVTGILHFYAQLHKRHNVLFFHYVRSLMVCGLINLQHIKLQANVSDILSKHCGYQACWELIQPIFHFRGDTGKFTTISDLRNFHDGECYHDVEAFPRWFKTYHDFRSKEFLRWECYHDVEAPMISMIRPVTSPTTKPISPLQSTSSLLLMIRIPLNPHFLRFLIRPSIHHSSIILT
jgi:hypothetical protein